MDLCQAIFFRLKSIISSRSPPHKTSNDVNRNPREARRKNMFYVWYVNLDCVHIHTPFSSARSAEKFLYCTINIFVVFQSILSIHTITPISSARSAEKYEIVLRIPYYFILCTHIITPLLFRAERRDKMLCITYYIQDINTCSVS